MAAAWVDADAAHSDCCWEWASVLQACASVLLNMHTQHRLGLLLNVIFHIPQSDYLNL